MIQITAGLKKEWFFFWRSFRFIGMIITFLGCGLLYPLLSGMMNLMGEALELMPRAVLAAATAAGEMNAMDIMGMDDLDAIFGMFSGESGLYMSYSMSLSMFATGVIIMMILLVGTAGQEQKRRSIIMPQTAGLTPVGYVLPKFILYPPMIFITILLSAIAANAVCQAALSMSYSMETVLLTGTLSGVSAMFLVCLYMFLGISLAQPGLAVLYVIGGDMVFGLLLTLAFRIDKFTPWNLIGMSDSLLLNSADKTAIAITIAITLILCIVFMFATLFAMNAKRMDNTADEVY